MRLLTLEASSVRVCLVALSSVFFHLGCDSGVPVDPAGSDGKAADQTCNVPRSLLTTGCEGADCIPSIDSLTVGDKRFADASSIEGRGDERVVGLLFGKQPLAISLGLLRSHEVLNFEGWSDRTFAVTHCSITGSSLAFDRSAIGDAEFGVSGLLFKNNLVMYDRRDRRSLWIQMRREGSCGPKVGTPLSMLPIMEMKWAHWKALHPHTKVLFDDEGAGARSTENSLGSGAGALSNRTNQQRSDERVLGIPTFHSGSIALPFKAMEEGPAVQALRISRKIVVFWSREAQAAMAFETLRSFAVKEERIVDDSTGSVWSLDGRAVEGRLEGTHLDPVQEAYVAFQWAWTNFHPETHLWAPPS